MGISSIEQGKENRKRVYDYIVKFITNNGYSPSMREISEGTGLMSTATVREHLKMLELLGMIHIKEGKNRTISLVGYKLVKEK